MWRGSLAFGEARIALAVAGSRAAPDPEALRARSVASTVESVRPGLERALFEHYAPYAEAVNAGEAEPPAGGLPHIAAPAGVWAHAMPAFVRVGPLDGRLTIEIGYRVGWDEEHTLGARFQDGRWSELCGSVLGLP
jgi:hypothetical protein